MHDIGLDRAGPGPGRTGSRFALWPPVCVADAGTDSREVEVRTPRGCFWPDGAHLQGGFPGLDIAQHVHKVLP